MPGLRDRPCLDGPASSGGPDPQYSSTLAKGVDIALVPKLAKSRNESAIHGAQSWSADVRKDEMVDTAPSCFTAHIERAGVATHLSNEPDGPVPAGRVGEKQGGARSPSWKF